MVPPQQAGKNESSGLALCRDVPVGTLKGSARDGGKAVAFAPAPDFLEEFMPPPGRRGGLDTGLDSVGAPDPGDPAGKAGDKGRKARACQGGRAPASGAEVRAGVGRAREMSAFEQQSLEKARARQKERLEAGEPQASEREAGRFMTAARRCTPRPPRLPFDEQTKGCISWRRYPRSSFDGLSERPDRTARPRRSLKRSVRIGFAR